MNSPAGQSSNQIGRKLLDFAQKYPPQSPHIQAIGQHQRSLGSPHCLVRRPVGCYLATDKLCRRYNRHHILDIRSQVTYKFVHTSFSLWGSNLHFHFHLCRKDIPSHARSELCSLDVLSRWGHHLTSLHFNCLIHSTVYFARTYLNSFTGNCDTSPLSVVEQVLANHHT